MLLGFIGREKSLRLVQIENILGARRLEENRAVQMIHFEI